MCVQGMGRRAVFRQHLVLAEGRPFLTGPVSGRAGLTGIFLPCLESPKSACCDSGSHV